MINVQISLPDDLAQRAKDAGLLSDQAISSLLEDAMRRAAGERLLNAAADIRSAGLEPMNDADVVALVKEVRAKRSGKA
jgi:post-segregation antitoxin (ccd killing protein)